MKLRSLSLAGTEPAWINDSDIFSWRNLFSSSRTSGRRQTWTPGICIPFRFFHLFISNFSHRSSLDVPSWSSVLFSRELLRMVSLIWLSTSRRTIEFLAAHMFIAARFILGFGVPFSIVGSASLIAGEIIIRPAFYC
jgi:hypothetical protein